MRLLTCLLAGAVIAGSPFAAMAQERVLVAGIEATRVVIAPPANELAATIKAGLSAAYYGAERESRAYAEAQKLYFFYGSRHFEPIWLTEGADGSAVFSDRAQSLIDLFQAAELEGLRPSDYLTDAIDLDAAGSDPAKLAMLETSFSAAALLYAQHIYGGRIAPRSVSSLFDVTPRRLDEGDTLLQLAAADDPVALIQSFEPQHREFLALKAALANFYDGSAEETVTIPEGPLLRLGMSDPRVPLLRQRLDVPFPTDGAEIVFDQPVVDAVMAFQSSLGLQPDGVAGPATIAALNGGAATSREDIIANMERWRWMPADMGDFHVFVNLPEFRLYIERGTEAAGYDVEYTTRVVIGTVANQTPIFSDEIEHVVMNPYWNVPSSIANNEIAPQLYSNPGYLASQNMELLYNGEVINAAAVDWSANSVNQFRIRQRPGPGNALGAVKFLFPNGHDVYLHDTPSKSLFERTTRAFSHGCVRVQNPMEFAAALLANETSLDVGVLQAQAGPSERWNNLDTHIPVHLAYFTLRIDSDGTIRSYGDIYGHNARLKELMGL